MAGRPREFDRKQALYKARDVFWQRGFEATSMSDLVDALGIASARIYAAFGSKEALFREAIEVYESGDGAFADAALGDDISARDAIERMLREAVELYTQPDRPQGCMVVSSATNCSADNDGIREWLAEHRRDRTRSIIERLEQAVRAGELPKRTDVMSLGDCYATVLHGLSVQARDGIGKSRLLAMIPMAMAAFDAQTEASK
ncbi:Transcriptional regulator, AcrR family [Pseudomonas chlororaphis subsp. aurantiaca]|uniref:TetR/AcrR family transcriptional regulator n=1 Tax=Pseudomonas TaxID=286 RepID=UPI000D725FA5|nr:MULTISPECIES: TetR/AcrR family transcriptional regulator [Pseudomonas]AZD20137.1 Transcriptional regulator, AcrR family [Pseudomonas chlororaphis subsp. aurantiaca]AZD33585.1 Transcriptional regulator, AcrR family [Pseudomonas chlororaphis subsp. aurantiaca]AZD39915.1 Transcriptional regulator, AcrR family [Pseudomonas chlororaphis subsp. aurantiaca]AZD46243.1 Transcriptional regulator, AcrR family [Pseudomonas chlororaphis subsp. aurantiaca]PWY38308.1 TetR family transcriptional regulator 